MTTISHVLLASASPRRRELLASLGLGVTVVPSGFEEHDDDRSIAPRALATINALGKRDAVGIATDGTLVVAADTVVDLDGAALGKPRDDAEARTMLGALSGRAHQVHTAFALRDAAGTIRHVEAVSTTVCFLPLDPATIDGYVASGDPHDKAGAYGIQGFAATLVERVDGDYFTVVGFPLAAFARALPALGYRLVPAAAGSLAACP